MARPFVPIGAVIFIALLTLGGLGTAAAVICCAAALLGCCVLIPLRKKEIPRMVMTCLLALSFAAGSFACVNAVRYDRILPFCDGSGHAVTARVTGTEHTAYGERYQLRLTGIDGAGTDTGAYVSAGKLTGLAAGDLLYLTDARLIPAGDARTAAYYRSENRRFRITGFSSVSMVPAVRRGPVYYAEKLRDGTRVLLERALRDDLAGVCLALLTGDTSGVPQQALRDFRTSGTAHLFAVSGLHLTLWSAALFALLKRLRLPAWAQAAAGTLFVLFFCFFAGFTRSVLRAGVMLIVFLCAGVVRRRYDPLSALFFAVSALLLADPYAAGSVSLQLSFAAVLGLVLVGAPLGAALRRKTREKLPRLLAKAVSAVLGGMIVSVSALLFTLPVQALAFGSFSIMTPLSNLAAVLPGEACMFFTGIGCVFYRITFISKAALLAAGLLSKYLLRATAVAASIPYAALPVPDVGFVAALAGITALVAICAVGGKKRRLIRGFVCGAALLGLLSGVLVFDARESVSIGLPDTGGGNAVVLRADGRTILLGCGGDPYRSYEYISYLNERAIRRIDLILLPSGGDANTAYLDAVRESFAVGSVVASPAVPFADGDPAASGVRSEERGTVRVSDRTVIRFVFTADTKAALVQSGDFSCLVLFQPGYRAGSLPAGALSADCLCVRGRMPQLDPQTFLYVFAAGEADAFPAEERIYVTGLRGAVGLRRDPFRRVTVSAEYSFKKGADAS